MGGAVARGKAYDIPKQLVWEAYQRVKANRGAAGVDGQSLAAFEEDLKGNLYKVWNRMSSGSYIPPPVKLVEIPKDNGGKRPLGIPTVADRVAQTVVKMVLEPCVEPVFHRDSYGYRPGKSALDAVGVTRKRCWKFDWVVDLDIKAFFDSIDHEKLMKLVELRISDPKVKKLLRQWLKAGVMEEGVVRDTELGSPQGGVISPLLANIYLNALDGIWERRCRHLGVLVRYADDAVVLCRTRADAEETLRRFGIIMERLSLKLHPDKTRIVELGLGKEGFVFLGCHLRIVLSHFKQREYLFRWPSPKAINSIRGRVRELTDRRRWAGVKDIRQVVEVLNPTLRGWGNYHRTGNASLKFQQVDRYVNQRLVRLLPRERDRRRRPFQLREWTPARFASELGLHRLVGTIRYPGSVNAS